MTQHQPKTVNLQIEAILCYNQGMTLSQIARRFGYTRQYISLLLRDAGLDPLRRFQQAQGTHS